ncbi:unnamed protein product [Ilex paraguariensis]|uniref:Origin recognition complex subunit 2 n=1 Tax=Ilex paraguariensis TaxID=185542 RepID=A0ABC8U6N4_9AQUA
MMVVITLAELLWEQLKNYQNTPSGKSSKAEEPYNSRSMDDLLAFLDGPHADGKKCFVCAVVHNIDGPALRDSESQQYLARISACSHIRIVASIDHVNAPLCKYHLGFVIYFRYENWWWARCKQLSFSLFTCCSPGFIQINGVI